MQDYSNRRGATEVQSGDVATCATQKKKRGKKNPPGVLAVSPTLCALQLYRITLFTSSAGSAALGESDYVSLQNNHIKTHQSGNLT